MNTDSFSGVLAIWNDASTGRDEDFEFWFASEHLAERLAVPGFRLGRRFEAIMGAPRYFTYYLTETPAVLTSPAYLARLNDPTPLTRTMMTGVFRNMSRTLCRRVERRGRPDGAVCVAVRFTDLPGRSELEPWLDLHNTVGIASCELWSADGIEQPMAEEEKLRGGDRKIAGCLIVQTLRESDARRAAGDIAAAFGGRAEIGIYRLLCELAAGAR